MASQRSRRTQESQPLASLEAKIAHAAWNVEVNVATGAMWSVRRRAEKRDNSSCSEEKL